MHSLLLISHIRDTLILSYHLSLRKVEVEKFWVFFSVLISSSPFRTRPDNTNRHHQDMGTQWSHKAEDRGPGPLSTHAYLCPQPPQEVGREVSHSQSIMFKMVARQLKSS